MQEERDKPKNPKPKTDYKLTSEFAKKLSMTGNTEKHEQEIILLLVSKD